MRLISLALAALMASAAHADDEEGYYYPPVTSSEVFERTLAGAPDADRAVRIGFVTQVTRQQFEHAAPPRFAVFAKGSQAQEMIIVALDGDIFSTLYRARAVMAQLSAPARMTEFFMRNEVSDRATFYDMIKLMGFVTLTLSDGETWSHRVTFQ